LALGSFAALTLGAAIAFPGLSSAGAATIAHHASAARHPVTRLAPRPHNGAAHILASPLINHGGPVETAPVVYLDFWGWGAGSDPSGEQAYLTKFIQDVGGSSWLATVNQYGSGSSVTLGGVWKHAATLATHPTDAAIQRQAARAAAHFSAGTSDNVEIVVATPHGHNISGFGTQFCAYHGTVGADPNITYTNLPYMTDAGSSCGEGSVNNPGTLDGVSIVEGHELAETITDPLLNAWFDSSGQEIGDKCAWINLQNTTLSGGGSFPTQPLYSNAANGCVQ
jgi:serine protease